MPRLIDYDYTFDGREDIALRFENGVGDYEITDIKKVVFSRDGVGNGNENELYYYWISRGGYAVNSGESVTVHRSFGKQRHAPDSIRVWQAMCEQ